MCTHYLLNRSTSPLYRSIRQSEAHAEFKNEYKQIIDKACSNLRANVEADIEKYGPLALRNYCTEDAVMASFWSGLIFKKSNKDESAGISLLPGMSHCPETSNAYFQYRNLILDDFFYLDPIVLQSFERLERLHNLKRKRLSKKWGLVFHKILKYRQNEKVRLLKQFPRESHKHFLNVIDELIPFDLDSKHTLTEERKHFQKQRSLASEQIEHMADLPAKLKYDNSSLSYLVQYLNKTNKAKG